MVKEKIFEITTLAAHTYLEESLETYNSDDIRNIFKQPAFNQLTWLAKNKIIKNSNNCHVCKERMSLVQDRAKRLNYKWLCSCGKSLNVLNDFFNQYKLPIDKLILILYYWSSSKDHKFIKKETKACVKSITYICSDIRELCFEYLLRTDSKLGGVDENGVRRIVEIDESQFGQRKYNRGRLTRDVWVLGGIERDTRKCFMVPIPDKKATTLIPIIEHYVLPGTLIITDGWAAYNNLGNTGSYEHKKIIHERNFVSPDDPEVHTQKIENLWHHAKRKMRFAYGLKNLDMDLYLAEFMFKHIFKDYIFTNIMKAVYEFEA